MSHDRPRIGEVAVESGVSSQTLRYHERRGLLRKPARRLVAAQRPRRRKGVPQGGVRIDAVISTQREPFPFVIFRIERAKAQHQMENDSCYSPRFDLDYCRVFGARAGERIDLGEQLVARE
jgi:hypothetical protein